MLLIDEHSLLILHILEHALLILLVDVKSWSRLEVDSERRLFSVPLVVRRQRRRPSSPLPQPPRGPATTVLLAAFAGSGSTLGVACFVLCDGGGPFVAPVAHAAPVGRLVATGLAMPAGGVGGARVTQMALGGVNFG